MLKILTIIKYICIFYERYILQTSSTIVSIYKIFMYYKDDDINVQLH